MNDELKSELSDELQEIPPAADEPADEPKKEKEYAARLLAPVDYTFNEQKATLQIIRQDIDGNKVISAVYQMDDKYYRVLWSRDSKINGDMTELQKALDWQLTSGLDKKTRFENSQIPIFFATLSALIDGRAFPQRATVDDFIKSAISFLYEKEEFWGWVTKWYDIARIERKPRRREPDLMNRLAQVDKTSRDDSAQWLGIRKPFHFENMRWVDEIIKTESEARGGRPLTHDERMKALARAGEYIYQNPETGEIIFVSDKGDFSISVTPNILQTVDQNKRREYLENLIKNPDMFDTDETIKKAKAELEAIDLYAGAFKTMLILNIYYCKQGRSDYFKKTHVLIIPKEDVKTWTGEDGKNGYRTFKRWLHALYNSTVNIKVAKHGKAGFDGDGAARFIYQIYDDQKYYYIGFNANLWPATREIVEAGKHADQSILSDRRYYYLVPRLLSIRLTPQAFYYADWITSETGNDQVKDIPDGQKVIAFSGEHHCANAKIQQDRHEKKPKQMILIWRELIKKEIIVKTEPSTKTLEKLKPKDFLKTIIRVYALKDNRELNELLRQKSQAEK